MTDPLDDLANALKAATPPPRDSARTAALRAAAEEFEKNAAFSQGTAEEARPIHNRPDRRAGLWKGLSTMFASFTRPQMLLGTTALASLAIAVVVVQVPSPRPVFDLQPAVLTEEAAPQGRLAPAAPLAELAQSDSDAAEARSSTGLAELAVAPAPSVAPSAAPSAADALSATQGRSTLGDGETTARPMTAAPAQTGTRDAEVATSLAGDAPAMARLDRQRALVIPPSSDDQGQPPAVAEGGAEVFPQAEASPLKRVADAPVSTFSIDVDTTSYALVRSSLQSGVLPPRQAVRVEEMVNYFDYAYPLPDTREAPFTTFVSVADTPWNAGTRLLHIGIQGYDITPDARPPLNLVFLIDTSGSMNDPRKLPLLVQSFRLLLDGLSAQDSIAIVTYAGSAGMVLEPTAANDRVKILGALDRLSAGGSTAGAAGLEQAYQIAERMRKDGELSRVILATDGDFNIGISDPEALKAYVADQRDSGTSLTVLGFGRGNYNDAIMQSLAQNGNGVAAYIDTLAEAQKVLVEDVTGALFPIAGDVKIQIEFNPAQVSEYRLIGYETRALRREDFNNDAVDAGDIGAGHSVTALYEITPAGSPAERISRASLPDRPRRGIRRQRGTGLSQTALQAAGRGPLTPDRDLRRAGPRGYPGGRDRVRRRRRRVRQPFAQGQQHQRLGLWRRLGTRRGLTGRGPLRLPLGTSEPDPHRGRA